MIAAGFLFGLGLLLAAMAVGLVWAGFCAALGAYADWHGAEPVRDVGVAIALVLIVVAISIA